MAVLIEFAGIMVIKLFVDGRISQSIISINKFFHLVSQN